MSGEPHECAGVDERRGEHDRAHAGPEHRDAEVVDVVVDPLARRRQRGREHEEGDRAEREVDVEDPAPRQVCREEATEQRSGDRGEAEHGAEQARVAPALARRDDVSDRRLRAHHQPAAAEPLHGAERDQLVEVLADPAQRRPEQEDPERHLQHDLAAVHVAELAVERCHDGLGEQVRRHHPREVVEPAEVADDRRQGGRHDRLVERGEEHDEQQAREHDAHRRPVALRLLRWCAHGRPAAHRTSSSWCVGAWARRTAPDTTVVIRRGGSKRRPELWPSRAQRSMKLDAARSMSGPSALQSCCDVAPMKTSAERLPVTRQATSR